MSIIVNFIIKIHVHVTCNNLMIHINSILNMSEDVYLMSATLNIFSLSTNSFRLSSDSSFNLDIPCQNNIISTDEVTWWNSQNKDFLMKSRLFIDQRSILKYQLNNLRHNYPMFSIFTEEAAFKVSPLVSPSASNCWQTFVTASSLESLTFVAE